MNLNILSFVSCDHSASHIPFAIGLYMEGKNAFVLLSV